MTKHIVDQPRDRTEGTRTREYTRIQREQGETGPHQQTRDLQRRKGEAHDDARRTQEFLKRERDQKT